MENERMKVWTLRTKLSASVPTLGLTLALALAALAAPAPASAQPPDIRSVPPVVMLLVDSSGSMEKVGGCACSTPACTECLPDCNVGSPDRNRWTTVVEAFTGTIDSYSCESQDRSASAFAGQPDYRYFMPHIAAGGIDCLSTAGCPSGQTCSADMTLVAGDTGFCQTEDGILDVYRDRAKFGLMTFDATSTFTGERELMTRTDFLARGGQNEMISGGYSYGGARPFSFPGCGEPYMIDNGARNEDAGAGRLVSVGVESVDDITQINRAVQGALLNPEARPFGATPIAGMLEDLGYYFDNHRDVRQISALGTTGDPFNACRARYAILVTDGRPTSDMRGAPYFCDALGTPVGDTGCPYDMAVNTAASLVASDTIAGLFVVGFNVSPESCPSGDVDCQTRALEAVANLNDIAAAGGTTAAIFADDGPSLRAALTTIMDRAAPGTTTRTVPAFGNTGTGAAGPGTQLQFNTGFDVGNGDEGIPWTGVLERRRIECDGLVPTPRPITDADRFQVTLNNQTGTIDSSGLARRLLTVTPTNRAHYNGHLVGRGTDDLTARLLPVPSNATTINQTNLQLTSFRRENTALTRQMLNVSTNARRNEIIDWVHGIAGTERENRRLGSIYHSSPAVVSAPSVDILDESFNLFRQRPEVAGRPTMLYVGSNDGVLHAFAAADHTFPADHPRAGQSLTAGEEVWGFIPPLLLRNFDGVMDAQQWMVDGSPVVRELFYARNFDDGDSGDFYHTTLFLGMRAGANGFVALDVTDPIDPQFLWQYTDPVFGNTYGTPTAAQALIRLDSRVHERGIVLLPGGHGTTRSSGACDARTEAPTSGPYAVPPIAGRSPDSPRVQRRCWDQAGRGLVILDVASGRVLRRWDSTTFPAPVDGGVSVFLGETGTSASRAFFSDADGVMWRVDLSNQDPSQWTVRAFHDVFHGMAFDAAQPSYPPPVLSTTAQGDVVILQGTGDIDRLDDFNDRNRVVSITEQLTFDTTGVVSSVTPLINWEITLDPGEQVTGPVDLFQGTVYFGSFHSTSNTINACEVGYSRIYGIDYVEDDGARNPQAALESIAGSGVFDRAFLGPAELPELSNQIIMGVAVTQRPTCIDGTSVSETDPYVGTRQTYRVNSSSAPTFQLVAQLSGGDGGTDGGSVGEFIRDLPPPLAYTDISGYAGSID